MYFRTFGVNILFLLYTFDTTYFIFILKGDSHSYYNVNREIKMRNKILLVQTNLNGHCNHIWHWVQKKFVPDI